MADTMDRLKVLLDSSTPIVVLETVEEMRAVRLVRVACSALNLTAFEWSIANGLSRCGGDVLEPLDSSRIHSAGYGTAQDPAEMTAQTIYNSREPAQVLGHLEGITI